MPVEMKAKELMIGNYVYYNYIDETPQKSICQLDAEDLQLMEERPQYLSEHEPIPITDELLLGNEFVKREINGNLCRYLETHYIELIKADGYYYPIYAEIQEFSFEDEMRVCLERIKYFHELQNLLFVLKKIELKINL